MALRTRIPTSRLKQLITARRNPPDLSCSAVGLSSKNGSAMLLTPTVAELPLPLVGGVAGALLLLLLIGFAVVSRQHVRPLRRFAAELEQGRSAGVRLDEAPRWAHIVTAALLTSFRWLRLAAGCFVYCTREAFDAVGGFDETYFGAEELVISRSLARLGRFAVLRESVTTSARKVHGRSAWEIFRITARLALRGRRGVRRREGMEFWYGDRR